jgi:peptidoglycan/xylan/chitin deacetylase (PgdA/CDA1 family)
MAGRVATTLMTVAASAALTERLVAALERLAPSRAGVLPVLTYHRIAPRRSDDPWDPTLISATPDELEAHLRALAMHHRPISASDLLAVRRGRRSLPDRSLLITFDDAYQDFAEHAWPILDAAGMPVTLFVPTAYPGRPTRRFWWDRLHRAFARPRLPSHLDIAGRQWPLQSADERRRALRALRRTVKAMPHGPAMALVERIVRDLDADDDVPSGCLDWRTLRSLAREGVTLASHTRTHAMLDRLSADDARAEVIGSLDDLGREVGPAPPVLAYPSGQVSPAVRGAVAAAGIEIAFTTRRGVNHVGRSDWLALRRINVGARSTDAVIRAQLLPRVGGLFAR